MSVPAPLREASDWLWRGLLVVLGAWVTLQLCTRLALVVVPFAAGLLLTALVYPLTAWLRRRGLSRGLAALLTAVTVLVVVGGLGSWIGLGASEQAPDLVAGFAKAIRQLPIRHGLLANLQGRLEQWLVGQAGLVNSVLTTLRIAVEVATGAVLSLFVAAYLVYDGDHVWNSAVGMLPSARQAAMREAGVEIWQRLAGWVRGTALIALFHAVVVGSALALMHVPLLLSLAVLVFIGSFVPLVGSFLFGGLAALVTFASRGPTPALVLVVVLVAANQVEAHLLQPFLVGRYVRLHPLAVLAAVTTGGILAGFGGAIFAVPLTATLHAAAQVRGRRRMRTTGEAAPEAGE